MKRPLVSSNLTIKKTISFMSKYGFKSVVLSNEKNILEGVVSDGDIRKSIFKNSNLNNSIKTISTKRPFVLKSLKFNKKKISQIFINKKYDLIPIVDTYNKILKIIEFKDVLERKKKKKFKELNIPIIIMSGGKGSRLEPFTKILPKPLIPIKDDTLISLIIKKFEKFKIKKIFFSINYKSKIFKAFIEEKKYPFKVTFIEENKPLGTVGSLSLIVDKIPNLCIVTNCDTILNYDYTKIVEYHKREKNFITIVGCKKNFKMPYGECKVDEKNNLIKIKEKPNFKFLVNTGFYVISKEVLKKIPKNKFYNFTDLLNNKTIKNKKISVYEVENKHWVDVGQWPEYKKAVKII